MGRSRQTYDPQSQREQTFTVNGTVILEGTGDNDMQSFGAGCYHASGRGVEEEHLGAGDRGGRPAV